MPWKNEIDRLVSHCVLDAAKEGADKERALTAVTDYLTLAPGRHESWFHVGAAREVLGEAAQALPEAPDADSRRWEMLGRLDSAGRKNGRDRVRELMAAPEFAALIPTPAGRVALRAVGRMLLRDGEEDRAFEFYTQHLKAVDEEGSRRDAEFLLEEALRRADRDDESENDEGAIKNLERAAQFVRDAGLDARAGAKVDRKKGRLHQLGQRWPDAVSCYQSALKHLPKDDPYRSVLVGDLALSMLGVRGTLDLLPQAGREKAAEAEALLRSEGTQGEGRSYNVLYTLGVLAYERGAWAEAADAFQQADALMQENRAKARIVHARARFFRAHCLLKQGAEGAALEDVAATIGKEAGSVSLDPALRDPVVNDLLAVKPDARISMRGGRERGPRGERGDRPERESQGERGDRGDRGGDRGDRGDRGGRERGPRMERGERAPRAPEAAPSGPPGSPPAMLAEARRALAADPHKALDLVDRTFKAKPDFETWFGAYRVRLSALVALKEPGETLSTYERFRAKLFQRSAFARIESLLLDPEGVLRGVLGEAAFQQELVELYDAMPNRRRELVTAALAAAQALLDTSDPAAAQRAAGLLREVEAHEPGAGKDLLARARASGASTAVPSADDIKARLQARGAPARVLVIGGDEGRKAAQDKGLSDLGQRVGFQGWWLFVGSRPALKSLREMEAQIGQSTLIVVHPLAGAELRGEMQRIGGTLGIPVVEAGWLGTHGLEPELLAALARVG